MELYRYLLLALLAWVQKDLGKWGGGLLAGWLVYCFRPLLNVHLACSARLL